MSSAEKRMRRKDKEGEEGEVLWERKDDMRDERHGGCLCERKKQVLD